jgi:hypothetical protein
MVTWRMTNIENDAECKIDGLAKDRIRVECLVEGLHPILLYWRRTESKKRCLDEEPNPSGLSLASSRTSDSTKNNAPAWRRTHGHLHENFWIACWNNIYIITTMHKYERFARNLDHTSISKFWVLCSKVCMKFWFTYFFQTTYLFDRIQTILESVFFQESRTFSSQDSGVGLIVWRLRRYEFYEECRLLDGDTLTAF